MRMVKNIMLLGFSILISSKVMALTCKARIPPSVGDFNVVSEPTVTLGQIIYLASVQNGEELWRSPTYTRDIECVGSSQAGAEAIYIYPFPKERNAQPLPSKVKIGVVFDGNDIPLTGTGGGGIDTKVLIPGWGVSNTGNYRFTKTGVKFYVYLKKDGNIDTSGVGDLTVFQLDGVGGLNRWNNYNFTLGNWNNVSSIDCTGAISNSIFSFSSKPSEAVIGDAASSIETPPKVRVGCSGSALDSVASITGAFTVGSSGGSFATNKTELSFRVFDGNTQVSPGGRISVNVPIDSNGDGEVAVSFSVTAKLETLGRDVPPWLFSDPINENDRITSNIPFSFSPTLVNLK